MVKVVWVRAVRQRQLTWRVNGVLARSNGESSMGMLTRSDGESGMGKGGETKVVNVVC
jgi:hypothetical protein